MKLTLRDAKAGPIPAALGYCPDSPIVVQRLNAFRERALNHGRWWGSIVRARFCVESGCITWPGIVANPERIAVNGQPVSEMRGEWSDFVANVARTPICGRCRNRGNLDGTACGCGCLYATDHLTSPVSNDIRSPKYVRVYPTSLQDVGKRVLVQGYDENRIPIRNQYSGVWTDGEYITIASPFATSTAQFMAITGVQKEATALRVLAYQVAPVSGTEYPLATWGPNELTPNYRRTFVPLLANAGCRSGDGHCRATVDAIVKLAYQPVALDTDWLIIDNMNALEHGCRGEEFFAQNRTQEGKEQIGLALAELNQQLRTMTGDRTTISVDLEGCAVFSRQFAGMR